MSEPTIKLPRQSKGKRPYFFDDPAIDQMMTFFVELTAEVSVVYDRLDTVERLLAAKGTISREDIENYRPADTVEAERMARRDAYLKRVFRMHPPVASYGRKKTAEQPQVSAPAPVKNTAKKTKKKAAKKKPAKRAPAKKSAKTKKAAKKKTRR